MAGRLGQDPRQFYMTVTLDWSPFIEAGSNFNNTVALVGFPGIDSFGKPDLLEYRYSFQRFQMDTIAILKRGSHLQAQVESYSFLTRGTGFLDVFGISSVSPCLALCKHQDANMALHVEPR